MGYVNCTGGTSLLRPTVRERGGRRKKEGKKEREKKEHFPKFEGRWKRGQLAVLSLWTTGFRVDRIKRGEVGVVRPRARITRYLLDGERSNVIALCLHR